MKYAVLTAVTLSAAAIWMIAAPEGSFASSTPVMTVAANSPAIPGSSAALSPQFQGGKSRVVRVVYVGSAIR